MEEKSTGCAKGCSVLFVAVVAIFIFGYAYNALFGEEDIRLTGTVDVSIASACEDPEIDIRPEGGAWQTVHFETNSWRAGQPCRLNLDVDVPPASRYAIRMDGVGLETIERKGDATTVRIELSW